MFGLRALEKGFFGGVAQSRPVSIGSSTLVPPRSAHLFGRPSSELGNQRSIDRTYAISTLGIHDMRLVFLQTPATAHRHDRSRSPSPNTSTISQFSTVNSGMRLYSSSPLSARVENSSTGSFIPISRIPGGNCHGEAKQVREYGRGTLSLNL